MWRNFFWKVLKAEWEETPPNIRYDRTSFRVEGGRKNLRSDGIWNKPRSPWNKRSLWNLRKKKWRLWCYVSFSLCSHWGRYFLGVQPPISKMLLIKLDVLSQVTALLIPKIGGWRTLHNKPRNLPKQQEDTNANHQNPKPIYSSENSTQIKKKNKYKQETKANPKWKELSSRELPVKIRKLIFHAILDGIC